MKKILLLTAISFLTISVFAQNEESDIRKFMNKANFKQINKDWSLIAEFSSGVGETVKFYPIEVINLKTDERMKALQLDMDIRKVAVTVWVGLDEIDEFIKFIENYVIPNLELRLKDRSQEYIFKAKEMTISFLVEGKKQRLSISLNRYGDFLDKDYGNEIEGADDIKNKKGKYYFWTETQVDDIPKLLEILKKLK